MLLLQFLRHYRNYLIITFITLAACSPSDDPSEKPSDDLAVIQIEPDAGPKNTIVKIAGSGFGLVPADHNVTLNGKKCEVIDVFGELLTIKIPPGSGSGKIKIELRGKQTLTPVFHYQYTTVEVVTVAGGEKGFRDGNGLSAQFQTPTGVAVDTSGNIFVVDQGNHKIRKISKDGGVTTHAGSNKGYADGSLSTAAFNLPSGIAIDVKQNLYVTDSYNDKVRKISPQGIVTTLAGSTTGYEDGSPTVAKFDIPYGIAVDDEGNVFVSDYLNCRIRKITATGNVTTLAGKGLFQNNGGAFADGAGTEAYFYYPAILSIGLNNTLYVADQFNHRIRSISTTTTEVTTIGGSGPVGQFNNGYADGPIETSRFAYPTGVCFNPRDSSILVADTRNHKIRGIKDETVITLTGNYGYADGADAEARFNEPCGIAVDRDGNIIIADSQNHRIRKIVFE